MSFDNAITAREALSETANKFSHSEERPAGNLIYKFHVQDKTTFLDVPSQLPQLRLRVLVRC
jgi:hypothetical protein